MSPAPRAQNIGTPFTKNTTAAAGGALIGSVRIDSRGQQGVNSLLVALHRPVSSFGVAYPRFGSSLWAIART
jgi:hypothetical protein